MNARNEREIARQLAEMPSAEPPAELLERIKADVPEELPVPGTRAPGGNVIPFPVPRSWLAAAAVVVMLAGGGLLTWRLTQTVESPQQALEMSDAAAGEEAAREGARAAFEAKAEGQAGPTDENAAVGGDEAAALRGRPAAPGEQPVAEPEPSRQEQLRRLQSERRRTAGGTGTVLRQGRVAAPAEPEATFGDVAATEEPIDSLDDEVDAVGDEPGLSVSNSAIAAGAPPSPPPPPPGSVSRSVPKPSAAAPPAHRKTVPIPDPTPDEAAAEGLVYGLPDADVSYRLQAEELVEPEAFAEEVVVIAEAPMIDMGSTTSGATFSEGDEVPTRWHPSGRSAAEREEQAPTPDEAALAEERAGFRDWGVSPFVTASEDRLSTFGLDVDTGSYTVLRRYLDDGRLPPAAAVRVEEIVNWFTYADPFAERPARPGETFRVVAEGAPSPVGPGPGHRLLRFQVAARPVAEADRKPATITLVVDNSGSMEGENLELVRAGLRRLVDNLGPDDLVALVGFSDDAWVVAPFGARQALADGIEAMQATDGTNAEAGLKLGYQLAEENYRQGAVNRVILLSDGVANVGATGPEAILARIGTAANRGIELTTVGVGMGEFNDEMLEQLADRGDGRYAYVDREEESERLFVEELTGTLQTVAEEARVQVEFDPRAVKRWRLLGYENRDIADERFRHDHSVDAGEVGAGQQVTALYEVELVGEVAPGRPLAALKLRWRDADGEAFQEIEQRLLAGQVATSWGGASRDLRLAAVAAELAEVLRGSPHARGMELRALVAPAKAVAAEFPGDEKVAELAELVAKAAAIARQE